MKLLAAIGTAFLSLTIAAPVYAQQEQHDQPQDKPAKEEKHAQEKEKKAQPEKQRPEQGKPQQEKQQAQQEKPQQEKPAQRDEQRAKDAKPAQQNEHQAQQDRPAEKQEHAQQQRGNEQPQRTPEQHRVQQSAMQQHRSHSWESDHRDWKQRGGYTGYRIPDDRFRGYFGQDHGFRITGLPFLVVGGYPRFQYSGYWFSMVDPWPEYWGDDWYDNDDVYVVYVDNGYYLYNNRYPNVGIAINISM